MFSIHHQFVNNKESNLNNEQIASLDIDNIDVNDFKNLCYKSGVSMDLPVEIPKTRDEIKYELDQYIIPKSNENYSIKNDMTNSFDTSSFMMTTNINSFNNNSNNSQSSYSPISNCNNSPHQNMFINVEDSHEYTTINSPTSSLGYYSSLNDSPMSCESNKYGTEGQESDLGLCDLSDLFDDILDEQDEPNTSQLNGESNENQLDNKKKRRCLLQKAIQIANAIIQKQKKKAINMKECYHVFEFCYDALKDKKYNNNIIKWLDEEKGIFKILRPNELAKKWGIKKNSPKMSFPNMARGIRYSREEGGYFETVTKQDGHGKKLVYKFSEKALRHCESIQRQSIDS